MTPPSQALAAREEAEPRLCLPPLPVSGKPGFRLPAGSCDAHVHIFGDASRFPFATERTFTPPLGLDLAALDRLHAALGFERAVLVQSGIQNADVMLEALRAAPGRLRGVAVVKLDVTDERLAEMDAAGVRGVRINLFRRAGAQVYRGGAGFEDLAALAPRIARFGWHVQAWLDANDLPELAPRLLELGLPVVVDHMGRITTDRGLDSPGFAYLRELLGEGRVWCKLSCADRISLAGPPYGDAVPYARALFEANPDRVVWGTDWPHVNYYDGAVPSDVALLDLVAAFAPDERDRERLFVANPRALYDFD